MCVCVCVWGGGGSCVLTAPGLHCYRRPTSLQFGSEKQGLKTIEIISRPIRNYYYYY